MNLHEKCCLRCVGYEFQSVARSTVPQVRVRSLDANLGIPPQGQLPYVLACNQTATAGSSAFAPIQPLSGTYR